MLLKLFCYLFEMMNRYKEWSKYALLNCYKSINRLFVQKYIINAGEITTD